MNIIYLTFLNNKKKDEKEKNYKYKREKDNIIPDELIETIEKGELDKFKIIFKYNYNNYNNYQIFIQECLNIILKIQLNDFKPIYNYIRFKRNDMIYHIIDIKDIGYIDNIEIISNLIKLVNLNMIKYIFKNNIRDEIKKNIHIFIDDFIYIIDKCDLELLKFLYQYFENNIENILYLSCCKNNRRFSDYIYNRGYFIDEYELNLLKK